MFYPWGGFIPVIYQPSYSSGASPTNEDFLITQSGIDILTQSSNEIIVQS